MARFSFADQLEKRIGTNTDIKLDKDGNRIGGGTKITEKLVEKVRGDEAGNLIILEDNAEQIAKAIQRAVAASLEEIGLAAERFAKAKCPVDTGRLRNSITHTLDIPRGDVYIGTNVEYAPYIELGTMKRKAHPFLHPAAEEHGGYYRRIIEKHMSK